MTSVAWHENRMYLAFGWDGTWDYSDLWVSETANPRTTWKRIYGQNSIGDMAWLDRSYTNATSFNGELHWLGGFRNTQSYKVISQHVSIKNGINVSIWQQPPWEAREAQGTGVLNSKLYMIGGVTYYYPDPGSSLRCFDDVWAMDTDGEWVQVLTSAPWGKLRSFGMQVLGGVFHIWGGFDSYNNVKNKHYTWDGINAPVALPDMPEGNAVFYHGVVDGKLCMVGGNNGSSQHAKVRTWDNVNGWVQHDDFPGGALVGMQMGVSPASGSLPEEAFIPYPSTNSSGWNIKAEFWGMTLDPDPVFTRYPYCTMDP